MLKWWVSGLKRDLGSWPAHDAKIREVWEPQQEEGNDFVSVTLRLMLRGIQTSFFWNKIQHSNFVFNSLRQKKFQYNFLRFQTPIHPSFPVLAPCSLKLWTLSHTLMSVDEKSKKNQWKRLKCFTLKPTIRLSKKNSLLRWTLAHAGSGYDRTLRQRDAQANSKTRRTTNDFEKHARLWKFTKNT